ncbi:MAG: TlpA family protein disulfide reductase [Hyphomonadaceae bacterium]|jgi:peroxiredoxin|nr:TlpA family protein disulfide reductase [Hyphomonadaceae bacterium]
MAELRLAPEWRTTQWFNTATPLSLETLRGRVVMVSAFQMLCPGCVSQGLPQAQRVAETFRLEDVQVVGLHTVFEHHDAMGPKSLEAFLHEYKIKFPVGVDAPDGVGIPQTMRAYDMRGTPTTLLIDRAGRLRRHAFGHLPDLQLGAELMALLGEAPAPSARQSDGSACTPGGCD